MAFTFDIITLRNVGKWYVENGVTIPDIQRDLLWTPKQIALLWDSIFKGMPIGTFMKQDHDNALIDGQQRLNAIATGYNLYNSQNPDAMIWLDFNGSESTTDKDIMITTISQPWGYRKDENMSFLSANERREAFNTFMQLSTDRKDIDSFYNLDKGIDLYHSWPVKATGLLIPFSCLLKEAKDLNEYVMMATECYRTTFNVVYEYFSEQFDDFSKRLETALKSLFEQFKAIESYKIGITVVDLESVKDIELLFNRLNTAGTQISDDDLAYAVIKANFHDIKSHDKDARLNYIEPSKLARIVLRIAASHSESKGFVGNLKPEQIRQKAEDKPENETFRLLVSEYYDDLNNDLGRVNAIFDSCNVPTVLRVSIAGRSPDIYMLLLYICHRSKCLDEDLKRILCGITFYLKWFCIDTGKAVNTIYRHIINEVSIKNIKSGIIDVQSQQDRKERLIISPLIEPEKHNKLITINEASDKWQPILDIIWNTLWNKTIQNREMLLYYQRDYISKHFSKYNPSNYKMWEGYNCPWDYDHIIPKDWFGNYSSSQVYARFCNRWKNTIGNLAAIKFEENRSKSNGADWSYYEENQSLLQVDVTRVKTITRNLNSEGSVAKEFARICFDRYCAIYEDCYNNLFSDLVDDTVEFLTDLEKRRKSILEDVSYHNNGIIHFVIPGESLEYPINDYPLSMWAMPWLTCGIIMKGTYYVAVAIGIKDDKLVYEIGVRKAPDSLTADSSKPLVEIEGYKAYNEGWWYIERDLSEDQFNNLNVPVEFYKLARLID